LSYNQQDNSKSFSKLSDFGLSRHNSKQPKNQGTKSTQEPGVSNKERVYDSRFGVSVTVGEDSNVEPTVLEYEESQELHRRRIMDAIDKKNSVRKKVINKLASVYRFAISRLRDGDTDVCFLQKFIVEELLDLRKTYAEEAGLLGSLEAVG